MTHRHRDPAGETRVLMLRHAESAAPDRFHGAESDVGLGERGHQQAAILAPWIAAERPDAVFSSAMRRAVETAEPIARACGLTVQTIPAIHERRMGPASGLRFSEDQGLYAEAKARWSAGELDFTHEGGESFAQIRDRVVPPLRELFDAHPDRTIVVVTHGVVLRVVLTSLLANHSLADLVGFQTSNGALNDLRWDGTALQAVSLNAIPAAFASL